MEASEEGREKRIVEWYGWIPGMGSSPLNLYIP